MQSAYLILENGAVFAGKSFGARGEAVGEIVFTTGMTGYLETLTDPSNHGQIILQTFPLIGNYGVIPQDFESSSIVPKAYIVKYPCQSPSNYRSEGELGTFLMQSGVVGLCDVDTREIAKMIRKAGVMNCKITTGPPTEDDLRDVKNFKIENPIEQVSGKMRDISGKGRRVAVLDFGVKKGILDELANRDCDIKVLKSGASVKEVLELKPDGILLSNGPGDPSDPHDAGIIATVKSLMGTGIPIFGICLGHLFMAIANGHKTYKLKFGHRGTNQPVKELATGRIFMTSQNHGYTVEADKPSFINVNDGTCEGIDYGRAFSVQFHPEGRGGSQDTLFLFDKFMRLMGGNVNAAR